MAIVEEVGSVGLIGSVEPQSRSYAGWAIVDVLGHQRFVGYVTTEYFGTTAFFRVLTPERAQRDRVVEQSEWPGGWGTIHNGSTVTESSEPSSERFIGAGSIYQLTPASKTRVMALLDEIDPRTVIAVKDRDGKSIEKPKLTEDTPF